MMYHVNPSVVVIVLFMFVVIKVFTILILMFVSTKFICQRIVILI